MAINKDTPTNKKKCVWFKNLRCNKEYCSLSLKIKSKISINKTNNLLFKNQTITPIKQKVPC